MYRFGGIFWGQQQTRCSLSHSADTCTCSAVGRIKLLSVPTVSLLWEKWAGSLSRGDRLLCHGGQSQFPPASYHWACFRRQRTDPCSRGEGRESRNVLQQAHWKTECSLNIQCIPSKLEPLRPLRMCSLWMLAGRHWMAGHCTSLLS